MFGAIFTSTCFDDITSTDIATKRVLSWRIQASSFLVHSLGCFEKPERQLQRTERKIFKVCLHSWTFLLKTADTNSSRSDFKPSLSGIKDQCLPFNNRILSSKALVTFFPSLSYFLNSFNFFLVSVNIKQFVVITSKQWTQKFIGLCSLGQGQNGLWRWEHSIWAGGLE